jgi:hypothetical protein
MRIAWSLAMKQQTARMPCPEEWTEAGGTTTSWQAKTGRMLSTVLAQVLDRTYGKDYIAKIHDDENGYANTSEMRDVATGDERDGNNVMRKHLEVILAAGLDVEHDKLVDPA